MLPNRLLANRAYSTAINRFRVVEVGARDGLQVIYPGKLQNNCKKSIIFLISGRKEVRSHRNQGRAHRSALRVRISNGRDDKLRLTEMGAPVG